MLSVLINALSKEELRHLKLLLNAFKKPGERLDVKLVDVLRRSPDKEELFIKEHYPHNRNAFYRLKNRLIQQINKSLLHLNFNGDAHHEVFNYILLARLFNKREEYVLCAKFLNKAEKKAIELDNHDYLNIIYNQLIELSYRYEGVVPEDIIKKQRKTAAQRQKMTEIKQVLAVINHRLKRTQNIAQGGGATQEWLAQIISRYANDKELQKSYQLKIGLYQLVVQWLLQKKDYNELLSYVQETYSEFMHLSFFNKENHGTRLQMLTYMINAQLALGEFEQAKQKAELLYDEMLRFGKLFYQKYLFFYYQTLVVAFSKSKPAKAIHILEGLKEDRELVSNPYYTQFILLNLSVLYYDGGEVNKALEQITHLKNSKIYKVLDEFLRIKVDLYEVLLQLEVEEYDRVLQLVKSFRKNHNIPVDNAFSKLIQLFERVSSYRDSQWKKEDLRELNEIVNKLTLEKNEGDIFFSLGLFRERVLSK